MLQIVLILPVLLLLFSFKKSFTHHFWKVAKLSCQAVLQTRGNEERFMARVCLKCLPLVLSSWSYLSWKKKESEDTRTYLFPYNNKVILVQHIFWISKNSPSTHTSNTSNDYPNSFLCHHWLYFRPTGGLYHDVCGVLQPLYIHNGLVVSYEGLQSNLNTPWSKAATHLNSKYLCITIV